MTQVLFQDVAKEWWQRYMLSGNTDYAEESWRRLEREVFPALGERQVKRITAPMVLNVLRRIEERGALEVVRKVKSHVSQIMRYSIACGHIFSNPARDLGWALTPKKHQPRAAITEPRQIGRLMADIDAYKAQKKRYALQLAALTFVRPGELCGAEWADIEIDAEIWRIPAAKMKMKRPHIVPLSAQAKDTLLGLQAITGHQRWLFPSRRESGQPMQGRVLNTILRSLGYDREVMTAHGFRAMAATSLSEQGWPSEIIERQLAHLDKNRVRAAYQRSELLAERRKMMQSWADYLDVRRACADGPE